MLRIGTWNVEYASPAKNREGLALIQGADADIWVLTEGGLELGSSSSRPFRLEDPVGIVERLRDAEEADGGDSLRDPENRSQRATYREPRRTAR